MTARKTFSVTVGGPRPAWLLAFAVLFLAAPAFGQSLGDIARQQRARKQVEPQQVTHVYDNDDLSRQQILLPADRDRVQAAAPITPPPVAPAAQPVEASTSVAPNTSAVAVSDVDTNNTPLGDIARHYRALKAARAQQQEESAVRQQTAPATQSTAIQSQASLAPNVDANANSQPSIDESKMSLGDIARYYRALKAAREQQQAQAAAAAEQHPMPATPALADPTFTQPPARSLAPPEMLASPAGPGPKGNFGGEHAATDAPPIWARPVRIRVRSGDTLWSLARKYLGRGRDWLLLAARNPQIGDPVRLKVGIVLRLPANEGLTRPDSQPAQRVRVERGDSLWKLSQAHFGDGGAWSCIEHANPNVQHPDLIFPGQTLALPSSCLAAGPPQVRAPAVSARSAAVPMGQGSKQTP